MIWLLPVSGTLSSILHPLAHGLVTTLAFLLFQEHVEFVSASGLLHLHFSLPGVVFFLIFPQSVPTHPSNQFQYHLLKRLPETTASKFKMISYSLQHLISLRSFIAFCNYVIGFIYQCIVLPYYTVSSIKAGPLSSCLLLCSTA